MIELGQQAKDKITGYEGILTARIQYITGCDQYGLSQKAKKNTAPLPTEYFDEGRIEIIGKGILAEDVQTKKNGGPNRDAPR